MPIETRYKRYDTQTVNGLLAFILGLTQTALAQSWYKTYSNDVQTASWGSRFWIRHADGSEIELTDGVPVAIVSKSTGDAPGLQSNTWDMYALSGLTSTDALVWRIYFKYGSGSWMLCDTVNGLGSNAISITEQLGAGSIDGATWTVYYYTRVTTYTDPESGDTITSCTVHWATSTDNTRITNFTWTAGAAAAVLRRLLVGVGL